MVSIDQLGYFKESNPLFKIVKPWWNVFTDYIAAAMLALAVLAGALQATSGHLYCLPAVGCSSSINQSTPAFGNNIYCKDTGNSSMLIKLQDRGQYDFVHAECKKEAVQLFVSYFPYIIFLETVLLMVVSNFWLKIPKTLHVVEHFVTLVNECYNTPGTSKVVCNTLWQTNSDLNTENTESTEYLEKSEANKAKNLQEKVRRFRDDVEKMSDLREKNANQENKKYLKAIWNKFQRNVKEMPKKYLTFRNIYAIQEFFKLALSLIFLGINGNYRKLDNIVNCTIPYVFSESYKHFTCSNVLVPFFQQVLYIFFGLSGLYLVLCCVAFIWTIKICKNKYDFHKRLSDSKATQLGDIDPALGDLAFMLHLLDKYNEMYSDRFAVFLSDKNGEKWRYFILANDWSIERLLKKTVDGERTLELTKLGGIPKTVFEMLKLGKLDKLILKSCKVANSDFNQEDWSKVRLRSLSIIKCFLTEIPSVIFELPTLESLNLSGNNIQSIPEDIKYLTQLKIFDISNNNITEGVEHIIAMKNLTANLCGNRSLKLGYSDDQPIELIRLYINKANIEDEEQTAFGNIARHTVTIFDVPVVKYSQHQTPEIEQENVYRMMSNPKGLFLHFSILSDPNAEAIQLDYMLLNNLFKEIGYKTSYCMLNADNTLNDFKEKLSKDLNDTYDSLIIVFSGSGTKEGMCPYRGEVMSVETIVDELNNFESLQGKPVPKLIIIQSWLDPTVSKKGATDKEAQECLPEYTLNVNRPACDDVVIAYCTLQSCISPPGPEKFSWFVRALVDVFSYYAWKEDVLSLLKLVNDELYRKCIVMKAYKHVSPPQSTLTKKWYLYPGYFEPDDSVRSQPTLTSTNYNQDESNV